MSKAKHGSLPLREGEALIIYFNMELRGGVEIPIALWGGLERRMGTMTRVLQAARYE